jgi:hypothetical protein
MYLPMPDISQAAEIFANTFKTISNEFCEQVARHMLDYAASQHSVYTNQALVHAAKKIVETHASYASMTSKQLGGLIISVSRNDMIPQRKIDIYEKETAPFRDRANVVMRRWASPGS